MSARKVVSLVLVAILLNVALVQASSRPAPVAQPAGAGVIAYVRLSTHDIHLISPDGTGDRRLWTAPRPLWPSIPYDLAWRPDGRELAFTSSHEEACSWYQSDVYAIGYNGGGYRRVTNAPACAALASLPKGSVSVNVSNYTGSLVQVYVAGASEPKTLLSDGTIVVNNVADFGPGVSQPAIGIYGAYRIMSSPPLADVQPGATVPGGNIVIFPSSGIDYFGAGKVSWKADGSAIGYAMRTSSAIDQIPAVPPYGSIGSPLPVVEHASPNRVAWAPTAGTQNWYLYSSGDDPIVDDIGGIYLNQVGDASGGTMVVRIDTFYGAQYVHDIEWLPDASGFLFSLQYVPLEIYADIFEYSFETNEITQLTFLQDNSARGLSVSPDGQYVVFERVDEDDSTISLWIMNRFGGNLHKLVDDAARPAWGRVPPPLTPRAYLPLLLCSR